MRIHRPTYAEIMSTLAVGLVLTGGTAYAATSLIKGNQIAKSAITSKHIKDGSIATKDLSAATLAAAKGQTGAAGPAGPAGAAGAKGPAGSNGSDGATGPRGFSAWEVLPSGQSIKGTVYEVDTAAGAGESVTRNVEYPVVLPAEATIRFGTGAIGSPDPACTGSYGNPTAPAGYLCIYGGYQNNISNLAAYNWGNSGLRKYAFFFSGTSTAAGSYTFYASWAYTAA